VPKRQKKGAPLEGLDISDPSDASTITPILSSEYVDVEKPYDPGNVYEQVAPFTTIPAWMRSFMFRILKSNEVAVYLYISTYAQKPGIAYVSLREMQRDFGFSNRHELIAAIEQLVDLGFLLRKKGRVARSKTEHDRSVYQRPSVAFTMSKLLTAGAIDGSFNPTPRAARRARRGSAPLRGRRPIERPMLQALDALLGGPTLSAYLHQPGTEKAQFLIAALDAKLEKDRNAAAIAAATVKVLAKETGT
jgi:hypothetical protein